MDDIIRIHELAVWTRIGIPKIERREKQQLCVTVELHTDTAPVAEKDNLTGAIDYDEVAKRIYEVAKTERKTLERFTEDVARMILTEFKPNRVTVIAQKFMPPDTKGVSVTVTRP